MTLLEKQIEMKKRWVVAQTVKPKGSKGLSRKHALGTKKCVRCFRVKPLQQFNLKYDMPHLPERRKSHCRNCGEKVPKRQWILQYWREHPCVDCGETDTDVLEFDHRDPSEKLGEVPRMSSIARMAAEAAKCDVRCANCHRRRHARERRLNALRKANLVLSHN